MVTVIEGERLSLGSFSVRRLLPAPRRQMIGPFIFFDHFGPAHFPPGQGIDVRPHPHIGLATLTYLFEGAVLHRDSLGSIQEIRPGDVNWMTAGRGIVHSERESPAVRAVEHVQHGIQIWLVLPDGDEDVPPAFHHHSAATLPVIGLDRGSHARLIAGAAYGRRSPVAVCSPMFYLDVELVAGGLLERPVDDQEAGVYVVSGAVEIENVHHGSGRLIHFAPGTALRLRAIGPARLVLFGGEPFATPRHIWWNFVASSQERIEAARQRWRDGEFDPVPGETEFIPLPE
jgi:redox-sensitive bicupin YhaK (pirin superfamily)